MCFLLVHMYGALWDQIISNIFIKPLSMCLLYVYIYIYLASWRLMSFWNRNQTRRNTEASLKPTMWCLKILELWASHWQENINPHTQFHIAPLHKILDGWESIVNQLEFCICTCTNSCNLKRANCVHHVIYCGKTVLTSVWPRSLRNNSCHTWYPQELV